MFPNSPIKKISDRRWNIAILLIFFCAIILRLIYYHQNTDNPLMYMPILDEEYYVNMGKTIAGGYWLGEGKAFFMDPLYGYLLGIIFLIFGDNLTTIRLLQIILDSFNVVIIYSIGVRVYNRNAGIVAALLYSFYKVAFIYTVLILKTTLSVTISLCFLLIFIRVVDKGRTIHWYLLGILSAIMIYLRANLVIMVPLSLLFYWLFNRTKWKRVLKNSILLVAGLATLLSVGILRTYYLSNEFVLFTTQAGRLLYSSNNPGNLTGRYNVPDFSLPNPEDSELDFHKEAERRSGKALSPGEVSSYWTGETFSFIRENPGVIPILFFNKLKGTIGNCEIPNIYSFSLASKFSSLARLPLPNFGLAVAFGVPGLLIGFLRKREVAWLFVPILTILSTIIIFYTSSRFRMPAIPFLLLGAGISFNIAIEWARRRRGVKSTLFICVVIVLFLLSLKIPCPSTFGNDDFFLSKAYWRQDDLEKARSIAARAARIFPLQARFKILLGGISLSEGKPERAIEYNLEALELDPNNIDAFHNMGLSYLEKREPQKAIGYFKKALAIKSRPGTYFGLARAYEETGATDLAIRYYKECIKRAKPMESIRSQAEESLAELGKSSNSMAHEDQSPWQVRYQTP